MPQTDHDRLRRALLLIEAFDDQEMRAFADGLTYGTACRLEDCLTTRDNDYDVDEDGTAELCKTCAHLRVEDETGTTLCYITGKETDPDNDCDTDSWSPTAASDPAGNRTEGE